MATELTPTKAAQLALGVYEVNSGDTRHLKAFLANRMFLQGSGQTLLKGEVGGRILKKWLWAPFLLCRVPLSGL